MKSYAVIVCHNAIYIDIVCFCRLERKQLAYILGTHQVVIPMQDLTEDGDELAEIASNSHLNTNFLNLAREVFNCNSNNHIC